MRTYMYCIIYDYTLYIPLKPLPRFLVLFLDHALLLTSVLAHALLLTSVLAHALNLVLALVLLLFLVIVLVMYCP